MCIVNDAFRQDSRLANERNTNPGTETSVGDVINPFNILNHQVFHLIGGNDGLHVSDKAFDDGGGDEVLDLAPGKIRVRILLSSPGSAGFVEESHGSNYLGEALGVLQVVGNQILGLVDLHVNDVDHLGAGIGRRKRSTCYGLYLRKETALKPELGVDLFAFCSRSSQQICWVERAWTPEPVVW